MRRALVTFVSSLILLLATAPAIAMASQPSAQIPPGMVGFVSDLVNSDVGSGHRVSLGHQSAASTHNPASAAWPAEVSGLQEVPIAGGDRFQTAIAASRHAFPDGADAVIIVNGYNWPDALSASSLAGLLDAPILLTPSGSMPSSVLTEISRLGAQGVIIVGGEAAVSTGVERTLANRLGADNVMRMAGGSRYETSALIAIVVEEVQLDVFGDCDRIAFVTTGVNFPDALGASPVSAATWWPIVLVNPKGMDDLTEAVLAEGASQESFLLGGTGALPSAIASRIGTITGHQPRRFAGATRYETAVAVSNWAVSDLGMAWDGLAFATGQSFPDALAGGVMQGREGSLMLLTPSAALAEPVVEALTTNKDAIWEVHYLGGENALSQDTRSQVQSILRKDGPPPPPPPPPGAGPVNPIPDTLWRPAAEALPTSGNYVYLESDPGDWIGGGGKHLYTPSDAEMSVSEVAGHLCVQVEGTESWSGDFQVMDSIDALEVGYYPGLTRYPFNDPATGGLSWSGEGRGSNTLTGWFVVDSVSYVNGVMTGIDLRFEQHSEGGAPALHGVVHWRLQDPPAGAGPITPVPDTLWRPAVTLPTSGNYVYLDSEPGDYIGGGRKHLYTPANSTITVLPDGNHLWVNIDGTDWWYGDFQTMNTIGALELGYYPGLTRYPFHDPAVGGLSWYGMGNGSNELTGWFVIDAVGYTDGVLTAVDLRFEQHSEGETPALHGVVHWRADS